MSAAMVVDQDDWLPREEWAAAFAAVLAARQVRTEPLPARPAPGVWRILSPLDPCEVCGTPTVFTLVHDGSVELREVRAVRFNPTKTLGDTGWVHMRSRQHVCTRRGGDRDA